MAYDMPQATICTTLTGLNRVGGRVTQGGARLRRPYPWAILLNPLRGCLDLRGYLALMSASKMRNRRVSMRWPKP